LDLQSGTYPGVAPEDTFERVAAIAVSADESGFDTVMVMKVKPSTNLVGG